MKTCFYWSGFWGKYFLDHKPKLNRQNHFHTDFVFLTTMQSSRQAHVWFHTTKNATKTTKRFVEIFAHTLSNKNENQGLVKTE